jgi:hypothetical protein
MPAPDKSPAMGFAPRIISNDNPKEFAEPAADFKPTYLRLVE